MYYNPKTNNQADPAVHDISGCTHIDDMPEAAREFFNRTAKPGYTWKCVNGQWPEEVLAEPAPAADRLSACTAIDTAAGAARARFATDTPFIEKEYDLAYSDALNFIAANYEGDCPETVQAHVDAYQVSPQQAADDIKLMGEQWYTVIRIVRTIRLTGKQAVERTPDDSDFMAIAQPYLDQLEAVKPE